VDVLVYSLIIKKFDQSPFFKLSFLKDLFLNKGRMLVGAKSLDNHFTFNKYYSERCGTPRAREVGHSYFNVSAGFTRAVLNA
jgi:hypothetical protein